MPQLYYLALIPPEPLRSELHRLQEEVRDRYQSKHALRSPPHITLVPPFRLESEKESELGKIVRTVVAKHTPFSVHLDGFDAFPPRVIFVRVREDAALRALQSALADRFATWLGKFPGPKRPWHPHLTIGHRDLSRENFYRAEADLADRSLQRQWQVQSVYLLRHRGDHWAIGPEFPLGTANS